MITAKGRLTQFLDKILNAVEEFIDNHPLGLILSCTSAIIITPHHLDGIFNLPPYDKIFIHFIVAAIAAMTWKLTYAFGNKIKRSGLVTGLVFCTAVLSLITYYVVSSKYVLTRNSVNSGDKTAPSVFIKPFGPPPQFVRAVATQSGNANYDLGFRTLVDNDFYWLSDKLEEYYWPVEKIRLLLLMLAIFATVSLIFSSTLYRKKRRSYQRILENGTIST